MPNRQRGAATLIIVMMLFFIMSLVAAYASRNLIFEQRTSANQYRSTQALEAAQAGLEWAIAQLNNQRIGLDCTGSSSSSDSSFRQRYVITDVLTGKLTARRTSGTAVGGSELWPTCVLDGAAWRCSCPVDSAPSLSAPSSTAVAPAFRVRFQQVNPAPPAAPGQAGVVRVQAMGCTRMSDACLDFDGSGETNEGRAFTSTLVALTGNAAAVPTATMLARQAITLTGAASVTNSDAAGDGLTLHAGGAISNASVTLTGLPGTPASRSVLQSDPALGNLVTAAPFSVEDRMFATVFNMTPDMFREQPAAKVIPCTVTCSAATIRDAILLNPGRPIWVSGNLDVDSSGDIGSSAEPVLLIVVGDLRFSVNAAIYGLVYLRTSNWVTTGAGQINGAVVGEGRITGNGTPAIAYDSALLTRLRVGTGSMVQVPGSWRDFR